MNPKLEAMIAAAKARTERILAEQSQRKEGEQRTSSELVSGISGLPSSITISQSGAPIAEVDPQQDNIISASSIFDPFTMDNGVTLNDKQREAVTRFGLNGESGCLIGPAGSGKTTTMQAIIRAAIHCGRISIIPDDEEHKYIKAGTPGIWGGSFTRIATRNLRDNFPSDLKGNVHTIHRLLEYEPEVRSVIDEEGKEKKIRIFKPTRNRYRGLAEAMSAFFVDETSMVGTILEGNLRNAVRNKNAQFVYIGDIAQLPPVMDDSILGYKLLELPVVELTEVYRHAGVIVELANHIRVGKTIPNAKAILPYYSNLRKLPRKLAEEAIGEWNRTEHGSKVTIHFWKNRLEGEVNHLRALQALDYFFVKEVASGAYDPMKHMILMPYNKSVGTIELNKFIANRLGKFANNGEPAEVHEVVAGFLKHYFAVGDKVFFEREEAVITKINKNGLYSGKIPQPASVTLDRWGHNLAGKEETADDDEFDSIDALLNINIDEDEEKRKNQGSHTIHLRKLRDEDNEEYTISTAQEINNLIFGYALTIHKSQGSQWEKVYCIFHNSHNRNLQRELLYTAITRAQKELYVICEPETFIQGVLSQHIVGNTLAQKAEYFKGKKAEKDKQRDLLAKLEAEDGEITEDQEGSIQAD